MAKKETAAILVKVPDEVIIERIIVLRDKKVMVDQDLAVLYGVSTKRLNEQVKRNSKRFPDDFMFQVTAVEKEQLIQLFEHLDSLKYSSVLPYVFTEHGAVIIQIVRVFTRIREMLSDNTAIRLEIEKIKNKLDNQDKNIELVFQYLDELLKKQEKPNLPRNPIVYKLGTDKTP